MSKGLRGVALVEKAIARSGSDVKPVPADKLATLTFPGGKPLPESMKRWLAFDGAYLKVFDDVNDPVFRPKKFTELCLEEFPGFGGMTGDDETALAMWGDFEEVLDGDCYLLPAGSDSRRFLYVGEMDSHGEYPVMVVDTDDVPIVTIESPGFDVYIAERFDVAGFQRSTYEQLFTKGAHKDAMAEQARVNFGGYVTIGMGGQDTERLEDLPKPKKNPAKKTPAKKKSVKKKPRRSGQRKSAERLPVQPKRLASSARRAGSARRRSRVSAAWLAQ